MAATVGIEECTFTVEGRIVVADPCYVDKDDAPDYEILSRGSGAALEFDARAGVWHAEIETWDNSQTGGWGERVAILRACAEGHYTSSCQQFEGKVGVDSGQMSVLPQELLPVDYEALLKAYATGPDGEWEDHQMLAFAGGAISTTGIGDGLYSVYVEKSGEQVTAVEIRFLEEEENDCSECGHPQSDCACCYSCGSYPCNCDDTATDDEDEEAE